MYFTKYMEKSFLYEISEIVIRLNGVNMIKILQIVPNMHAAGLETLIMNIYRNIDREKVQFDFLTHYKGIYFFDEEIQKLGGHIYRLSFREDRKLFKYITDLNNFFAHHNDYDIVHCHMASTSIFTLGMAKKYGVPVRILHSHNTSTEKTLKGKIKHLLLHKSTKYANYYFACGNAAGKYLYKDKEFTVINNAIDLDKFKYATPHNSGLNDLKGKFVVGHIGRFSTQKNHSFLIEIFEEFHKQNNDTVLLMIGEGELEQKIKDCVEKKELEDSVFFLGVRNDVERLYKLFDVFVLPSLFEGLPVVGIESQAAGIRTILSDKITEEVNLTNYVSYLPIDQGIRCWVEALNNIKFAKNVYNTEEEYCKLVNAGYDIGTEAMQLQEKYQYLINEQRNKK